MYDELQSYKTDLYAKILKPFILSTIALIDDTNSFLAKLDENDSRKAEKYLRGIPDDLIDILESNGVELFESESEIFDPRTQKVIKTVPVNDAMLEKHIVRHVRPGYKWNDSILKPEIVIIYKFEANH
jgi:molecular chaperone GrpE (heat shock protein)